MEESTHAHRHVRHLEGPVHRRLIPEHAPETVANFVGLATGGQEWTDPRDGQKQLGPAVPRNRLPPGDPGFMIQGGDPTARAGGPGYQFEDEFPAGGPSFDKPGLLAMANAGPGTNGSQFFVTVAAAPWLTGKHTIFGEVTEGYEVVEAIARRPRGPRTAPGGRGHRAHRDHRLGPERVR